MLSVEVTYTSFIVFGLTRPGLEPTIYRTRGEHANHYATDAVIFIFVGKCKCLLHLAISIPLEIYVTLTCRLYFLFENH